MQLLSFLWVLEMRISPYCDSQQEHPISHCSHCHGEIYSEDECYLISWQIICSYCLEDFEKETRSSIKGYELDAYLRHIYGGLDDIE